MSCIFINLFSSPRIPERPPRRNVGISKALECGKLHFFTKMFFDYQVYRVIVGQKNEITGRLSRFESNSDERGLI